MFSKNDLVIIKNNPNKIIYLIKEIKKDIVVLHGYIYRIVTEENINNLIPATGLEINKEDEILNNSYHKMLSLKSVRNNQKAIFGTILHIDGDKKFLDSCLELYKEMNIFAWGIHIKEKEIKRHISEIIDELLPDIIVITGHDFYNNKGIKNLNNYENTSEFIETLRIIRRKFSKEDVIIIAGACGSNFEALIANGANFASSPKRINIHTYDPAVIAIKCATTSCNKTINFESVLKYIENGRSAYGGIETKGKMKLLL